MKYDLKQLCAKYQRPISSYNLKVVKKQISKNFLGLVTILIISFSCSSEDESNIIGEWNLKSIETECAQGDLSHEAVTFESNDICCISLLTTEKNDTIEITYATSICQKLIFNNDNEIDIITGDNTAQDTVSFPYQVIDNDIEVCVVSNQCINYSIVDNSLELEIEITTRAGLTCNRKLIYQR